MRKNIMKLSLASVLLIALQACNFPSASNGIPHSQNFATAQARVMATQTAHAGIPITGGGSATPPVIATQMPTQALPSKLPFVRVHVSVATNCRTGPGTAYPEVSALQVGQVARVIGRSKDNLYWIIRDPNQRVQVCWLWSHFATVTGNANALPIFTPPPPPPPTLFPPIPAAPSISSTAPIPTP